MYRTCKELQVTKNIWCIYMKFVKLVKYVEEEEE